MQTSSSLRIAALALALVATGCHPADRSDDPDAAESSGLLSVGSQAPALKAAAHDGSTVDLGALSGPTVVYFYPKDNTPGCTKEACAFRDAWDRYKAAGVMVVGVSADSLDSHRAFAEQYTLPFPLVSDADFTWAKAFGVPTNGQWHKRVSVLLSADGKVAQVYPGVDPGVHADEVLADAAKL